MGRAPAPVLPDAGVPHLRHPDARGRDDLHRRALPGDHGEALEALRQEPHVPALRRALISENKYRAARFGHRRQAHRLRQEGGGAAHGPPRRSSSRSSTTSSTSSARGTRSSTSTRSCSAGPARTGSSRCTRRRRACRRSWTTSSRRRATASTEPPLHRRTRSRARRARPAPPGAPESFPSVSTDTRAIPAGALFVALKGERFDAHAFLAEAKAKGAGAPSCGGHARRAGPPALRGGGHAPGSRRARAFSPPPVPRFPSAAVAGSNGKTTTKEMLAAILRTRGPALATEGNLNNEIGVPLTLLRLSGRARRGGRRARDVRAGRARAPDGDRRGRTRASSRSSRRSTSSS